MITEKSCGAIVYRRGADGLEFLVLNEQYSDKWGFPKGHMEAFETEEQTALREMREETGLTANLIPEKRVVSGYDIPPFTRKQVVLFLGEVHGTVTPQEEEIMRYKWVTAEELGKYLHKDTYAVCKELL